MSDKARRGLNPVRNFGAWLKLERDARRFNAVVELTVGPDFCTETAIMGNNIYPSDWTRQVPPPERTFSRRLDFTGAYGGYRRLFGVVASGVPSWDSGIRFLWCSADHIVPGSGDADVLAVNLRNGGLYSPPKNRLWCWASPQIVSCYQAMDEAGWRSWSNADERCAHDRLRDN